MDARDVIIEMVKDTGLTHRQVSVQMGHESTYLKSFIYRGQMPRVNTFVKVADACGYDLIARRRIDGYEMPIDNIDD